MSTILWIILIVLTAAAVGVGVSYRRLRRQRRRSLQDRTLSEYDRAARVARERVTVERALQRRLERRNVIQLHDRDARHRDTIRNEWLAAQLAFVDDPTRAVARASRLVHLAIAEREYPRDPAIDELDAVVKRSAGTDTDQLRLAFVRYRSVFDRLVDDAPVAGASPR